MRQIEAMAAEEENVSDVVVNIGLGGGMLGQILSEVMQSGMGIPRLLQPTIKPY